MDFVVRHVACTSGNGADTDVRLIAVPNKDDEGGAVVGCSGWSSDKPKLCHGECATMEIPCTIAMASATPSKIALVKLYQRVK